MWYGFPLHRRLVYHWFRRASTDPNVVDYRLYRRLLSHQMDGRRTRKPYLMPFSRSNSIYITLVSPVPGHEYHRNLSHQNKRVSLRPTSYRPGFALPSYLPLDPHRIHQCEPFQPDDAIPRRVCPVSRVMGPERQR